MVSKERNSNIELLRIICMCMIIAHHCVVHGEAINMDYCNNKWIALFFIPGGKLGFDVFIAITMFYLVDSSFKFERYIRILFETIFYSVLTMMAASYMGANLSLKQWISGFFPISGGGVHGYITVYLLFYLLYPILKRVDDITRLQNVYVILILSIIIFVERFNGFFSSYAEISFYSDLVLFVWFYFVMRYIKKYSVYVIKRKMILVAGVLFCWIGVYLYYCLAMLGYNNVVTKIFSALCAGEGGLLYICGGICLFLLFNNLVIPNNYLINSLARTTLAVLLVHDGHFFRKYYWSLFNTREWFYKEFFALRVLACVVITYVVCSILDYIRRVALEEPLFRNEKVKSICLYISNIIS